MFFSVIVPVYNVAPYLRQCLDSLVNQTCTDQEIILVDDGSDDGSGAICEEYAERCPFLKVIHQENQGLSGARNSGLARASGEWIVFADSDDWADPDLLEILKGHLLASGADFCRLSYRMTDESGMEIREYLLVKNETVYTLPDEESRFQFYFDSFMKTVRVWGSAFRRSIIEEHGLRFVDARRIYAEDLLFTFQYLLYAEKIAYLKDAPYYYRKRSGSLTDRTGFKERLPKIGALCEIAYQTVETEQFAYFRQNFYLLYFKILNRFILRDGAGLMDEAIRKVLDEMGQRAFHREQMKKIRRNDRRLRRYTRGRLWYKKRFGSETVWHLANRLPLIWSIWFAYQNVRYIRNGTTEFMPRFYKNPEQKAAYLTVPKAACSSILVSMLNRDDLPDDYSLFRELSSFRTEQPPSGEEWFSFTFVRNPFSRLVSCYESKFHMDREKNSRARERHYLDLDHYLHGYMAADRGFAYFINQICRIPWRLDNRHFCSQYHRVVGKDGKPLVDFIGKFEHLEEEYEPIRQKYGFSPLKVYNKSEHGDWRDYYTTDLAKKVYRKYKKDVQYFDYEQEYRDLLDYCAQKEQGK